MQNINKIWMQTNQSCQYANKCALKQTTQNFFFLILSSDDPWMQIKLEYFRYVSKILVRRLKNQISTNFVNLRKLPNISEFQFSLSLNGEGFILHSDSNI